MGEASGEGEAPPFGAGVVESVGEGARLVGDWLGEEVEERLALSGGSVPVMEALVLLEREAPGLREGLPEKLPLEDREGEAEEVVLWEGERVEFWPAAPPPAERVGRVVWEGEAVELVDWETERVTEREMVGEREREGLGVPDCVVEALRDIVGEGEEVGEGEGAEEKLKVGVAVAVAVPVAVAVSELREVAEVVEVPDCVEEVDMEDVFELLGEAVMVGVEEGHAVEEELWHVLGLLAWLKVTVGDTDCVGVVEPLAESHTVVEGVAVRQRVGEGERDLETLVVKLGDPEPVGQEVELREVVGLAVEVGQADRERLGEEVLDSDKVFRPPVWEMVKVVEEVAVELMLAVMQTEEDWEALIVTLTEREKVGLEVTEGEEDMDWHMEKVGVGGAEAVAFEGEALDEGERPEGVAAVDPEVLPDCDRELELERE